MHHQRLIVELIQCKKLISYAYGQAIQSDYIQRLVMKNGNPALLVFEFEPVYTCGLRRSSSIITSADIERFHSLGAHFHETDRGGLLTFHGPGQLVAYPILPLQHPLLRLTLRTYITRLEQTLVDTCREILGQTRVYPGTENGQTVNYAGAWVDNQRKVAFMGVRYSRGITSHGVSINCSIDMNWFNHIVPCGFDRRQITSLTDEVSSGKTVTVKQITPIFLDHFQRVFNVDLQENQIEKDLNINLL
jgi:lipoate-protein ligase B